MILQKVKKDAACLAKNANEKEKESKRLKGLKSDIRSSQFSRLQRLKFRTRKRERREKGRGVAENAIPLHIPMVPGRCMLQAEYQCAVWGDSGGVGTEELD